MSYSISPAQQKPAQQPYPPYQNSASPTNIPPFGPPPAKRQRISPDPRSPPNGNGNSTPTYAQSPHGLPNVGGYGNPYAPRPAQSPYGTPGPYASSPQGSFNTPQPYPYPQTAWQSHPPTPLSGAPYPPPQNSPPQQLSREMMPPPPRPKPEDREDKAGFEDLGDSLFGSGINLKDEENYMHNVYYNRHTQGDSFSTNQNTSFGSSTMSGNNSFNLLTQGTSFGSQDANGAFAGTLGQPTTEDEVEKQQRRKRQQAARDLADRQQHHLSNQFLLCNILRKRMDKLAMDQGVSLNMTGCFVRQVETKIALQDNKQGIVAASEPPNGLKQDSRPESVVNQNVPFEHLVSLVSLAAGERLRGLLEEANTLARARRYGDHGRVPPEFADIAVGEGKQVKESVVPLSITNSPWDKIAGSDPEVPNSATPQPQPTISFEGTLNTQLRGLAEREKAKEAARIQKRLARKRAAEAADNGDSITPTDAATANGTLPEVAPVKMTKKEQARQAKESKTTTEAQQLSTMNQTAAMMSFGKKKKKYDWMQGGAAAMPTNRFAKPQQGSASSGTTAAGEGTGTPAGPATPGAGGTAMVKTGSGMGQEVAMREWGMWTEQGSEGIEMRDWVLALERDRREKVALEKAMNALK